MNSSRWAAVAAAASVAAVLAVVIGVPLLSNAPGTAAPRSSEPREALGFDGAFTDRDPNVLVVRYGDSGTCPSLAVRHDVFQEPARVVVTLTRTPMPADRICTADYHAKLVRVLLSAPLGSREVIDGSTKKPVPLSTGAPPFG